MIETLITELIAALNANTAAHLGNSAPATPAPATKKAKAAPTVVAPEEPAPEEAPTVTAETPTPTPAKAAKAADTPHVPAAAAPAPGQPDAGEHVDPDEIISSIQSTVKSKMLAGDPDTVKAAWMKVQKDFGIARVAELRNDPARLLEALAKAKAL